MTGPGGIFPDNSFGLVLPEDWRDKFYAAVRGAGADLAAWQEQARPDVLSRQEQAA